MDSEPKTPDRIVLNILSAGFGSGTTYELRSSGMFGATEKTYTAFRQELLERPTEVETFEIDNDRPFDSNDIDASELEALFDTLRELTVPLLAANEQGFDGAYYNLRIFQGAGHVSVYSWCVPSPDLLAVHDFQRQFTDTLDQLFASELR